MQSREKIEQECMSIVHEILNDHSVDGNIITNGDSLQLTIVTKKIIWSDSQLNELRSALNAHEAGFWADENGQNIYFMFFYHFDYLEKDHEHEENILTSNKDKQTLGN